MNIKKCYISVFFLLSNFVHASGELSSTSSSAVKKTLEDSVEELQKKIDELRKHIVQLVKSDPSKLSKATQDLKDLKALRDEKIKQAAENQHKAHVQIRLLKQEINTLSSRISRNKNELAKLLNIEALTEELAQYKSEEDFIAALSAEEKAHITEKEINDLRMKIAKTQKELGQSKNDPHRINILRNTIHSDEEEITSLKNKIKNHIATIKAAEKNREIGE